MHMGERRREPWYVQALQPLAWVQSGPVGLIALAATLSIVVEAGRWTLSAPVEAVLGIGATASLVTSAIAAGRGRRWAPLTLLAGEGCFAVLCVARIVSSSTDSDFTRVIYSLGLAFAIAVGMIAVAATVRLSRRS